MTTARRSVYVCARNRSLIGHVLSAHVKPADTNFMNSYACRPGIKGSCHGAEFMSRNYAPRSLRSLRQWPGFLYGKEAVGLRKLMMCWRYGFYPDRALAYDFDTWRPEQYLPDGVQRAADVADASYGDR